MTLVEQINEGIKEAIKSRNQLRLDTLRMLKSKILAADARSNLSDTDVVKLFKTYFGNLEEALDQAQIANRPEMVERLKGEMEIVKEFLPRTFSTDETRKLVQEAISESGAKSRRDIGLVMKNLKKHGQSIDGKLAKDLADQLLGE